MKILAVRGENLTSLDGPFELDLERGALGGHGVFAITGPVGSGKSTLLDALCLALFDRTPRFNLSKGVLIGRADEDEKLRLRSNDVRSVLRRGAVSAYAEVDFRGIDGVVYRATWSVRRARNKPGGAVQSQAMSLRERDTDRALGGTRTEVLKEIRERVGLSFDQFCRSALLAQGEFAKFLKADDRDRAELLERMTGTELYGQLSIAAFEKRKESELELQSIAGKLEEQPLLEDEARQQLESERDAVEREHVELTRLVTAADAALRWYRDLQELQTEERNAAQTLATAEAETVTLGEIFAQEANTFRARLRQHTERVVDSRDACENECITARQWLERHRGAAQISDQWDRWDGLLRRYRSSAVDTRELETARTQAEANLATGRAALVAAEAARDAARQAFDRAEAAHHAALAALGEGADSFADHLREVDARLATLRGHKAALEALAATELAEQRGLDRAAKAETEVATLATAITAATGELTAAVARREEAERALREAERIRSLDAHRHDLIDGEPCPLCGATEHPYADPAAIRIESDLEARTQQLRSIEDELRTRLTRAERERAAKIAQAGDARAEAATLAEERAAKREALPAEFASREQVDAAHQAAIATRDELLERQKRVESSRTAVERERQVWNGHRETVVRRERNVRDVETEVTSRQEALCREESLRKGLVAELAEGFGSDEWWVRELATDPDGFVDSQSRLVLDFDKHKGALATSTARLEGFNRLVDELQGLIEGVDDQSLHTTLKAVQSIEFDDRKKLAELLQRDAHRRELHRQRDVQLMDGVKTARAVLEERQRRRVAHEESDHPAAAPDLATEQRDAANVKLAALRPRRDELLYTLRRDDEARKEIARLTPLIAAQKAQHHVWEQLNDLIGSFDGRAFRVFAQSLTLDALLASANHHLQDLQPRYRLQRVPQHDLDLQIVDLDMGEDVRSVNSLSGGETFLVSLALALGLSSISSAATRVESLFIDEGFGTLDMNTLDAALATLDALQATGRQVGIISHVAQIAERIGMLVQVTPVGPGRSKVLVAGA